jgi:serine/threonine protein kinase
MDIWQEYLSLPKALRWQVKHLVPQLHSDPNVRLNVKELKSILPSSLYARRREVLYQIAVLLSFHPRALLEPQWFKDVFAYDKHNHIIRFSKIVKEGKHATVLKGSLNGRVVVAKIYMSHKRDTRYEMGIYKQLEKMGCTVPWISYDFYFWNQPIIVMEYLDSVGTQDNEYRMAVDVLKQLRYLHQFAIHNDIKPGNIMRKSSRYYVIDYGGVASEKYKHGYRRWIWSPRWTSQKPHEPDQVTTAKYDLIELGYTMKSLQNDRKGAKRASVSEGFDGILADYMHRVAKIPDSKVTDKDYRSLVRILKKGC